MWSPTRSLPVFRRSVELVNDSGRVVIRLSQDVTKPANTVLSDCAEDVQLAIPQVKLLIRHKVEPMHPLYGPEGTGLEAIDAGGKNLSERPSLNTT